MTDFAAVSGFGPGAMIMTTDGELPVEWLESGDRVITRDRGAQPILHIARSHGALADVRPLPMPLQLNPKGAAGQGALIEPLRLSPHARVLLRDPQVGLHFGTDEVMAAVGDLSRRKTVSTEPDQVRLTYHHIVTGNHDLIWCCGIWVETTDAETAGQLNLPGDIAARAAAFKAPRPCLTGAEARMIRETLLDTETLLHLIAA